MDGMQTLQRILEPHLERALSSIGVAESKTLARSMPERPAADSNGDLAVPCFQLAGELRRSPAEIAADLCESLLHSTAEDCTFTAENIGAFVNIRATQRFLWDEAVAHSADAPGAESRFRADRSAVLIEHTSANPNGPFHVGRIRNAVIGDTMVRLERLAGAEVRSEYYVDDMGKQVGILCWALENLDEAKVDEILAEVGLDIDDSRTRHAGKEDHNRVRWYQAANQIRIDDETIEDDLAALIKASEEGDRDVLSRFSEAFRPVLDGMLETLTRLGIEYDVFTDESRFVLDGSVDDVVLRLRSSELCHEAENGAAYLELEGRGVAGKSTRFYFMRGDGTSLYATRDIAYHEWKSETSSRLLDVLGEDHRLQSKQVSIALDELGSPRPEVLFYAFTKLPDGKMSTRRGNVVFVDDLLDEAVARAATVVSSIRDDLGPEEIAAIAEAVGVSAVRFNIARIAPEKGIEFRWEDALSFEADSAPFIQYAHARACSLVRKVDLAGIDAEAALHGSLASGVGDGPLPRVAIDLLRAISLLPEELAKSVDELRPNRFCNAVNDLAARYNRFYRECYVLTEEGLEGRFLAISESARHHLRISAESVGIVALETM